MTPSIDIPLDFPVEINGQSVSKLAMRRPKVADVRTAEAYKGGEADKEILLFANLCDIAPKDIEKLDYADYGKLQEAFRDFRGRK